MREVCARPGRLVRTPTELHVVIAMAHADLAHRRAASNHDPDYVQWLRRTGRIELAGAIELSLTQISMGAVPESFFATIKPPASFPRVESATAIHNVRRGRGHEGAP